jgi:hypothetical protein
VTPNEASPTQPSPRQLKVLTNSTTLNQLAKFDSVGVVTDSAVYAVNGAVGIGTTAPAQRLHVFENADVQTYILAENLSTGATATAAVRAKSNVATTTIMAHSTGRTITRYGQILGGWSELLSFQANGLAIGTVDTTPIIIGTAGYDRLHITAAGDVGIGIAQPEADLHILSDVNTPSGSRGIMISQYSTDNRAAMHFLRKARGTLAAPLPVVQGDNVTSYNVSAYDGTQFLANGYIRYFVDGAVSTGTVPTSVAIGTGTTSAADRLTITSGGDVLIGTTTATPGKKLYVVGDVQFDGSVIGTNIRAQYQDVAEWVPSAEDLTPGTVVVVDKRKGNTVRASMTPYDTSVAGVVSGQPGIILGEASASKEQVATTGRVRVRVDASKGAIELGDLLVTSDIPGTAMKSVPVDLGGIPIHRPGTIIGKALEPLDSGVGEILVLLSLQ